MSSLLPPSLQKPKVSPKKAKTPSPSPSPSPTTWSIHDSSEERTPTPTTPTTASPQSVSPYLFKKSKRGLIDWDEYGRVNYKVAPMSYNSGIYGLYSPPTPKTPTNEKEKNREEMRKKLSKVKKTLFELYSPATISKSTSLRFKQSGMEKFQQQSSTKIDKTALSKDNTYGSVRSAFIAEQDDHEKAKTAIEIKGDLHYKGSYKIDGLETESRRSFSRFVREVEDLYDTDEKYKKEFFFTLDDKDSPTAHAVRVEVIKKPYDKKPVVTVYDANAGDYFGTNSYLESLLRQQFFDGRFADVQSGVWEKQSCNPFGQCGVLSKEFKDGKGDIPEKTREVQSVLKEAWPHLKNPRDFTETKSGKKYSPTSKGIHRRLAAYSEVLNEAQHQGYRNSIKKNIPTPKKAKALRGNKAPKSDRQKASPISTPVKRKLEARIEGPQLHKITLKEKEKKKIKTKK